MGVAKSKCSECVYGLMENTISKNKIEVKFPLEPNQAELVWQRVGSFDDLRWLFGRQPLKVDGKPTVVGCTRTFPSGGVETLTYFDEAKRQMQWSLNRFPHYLGSFDVTDDLVHFQIKAQAPKIVLDYAKTTTTEQLGAVVSETKQRLLYSKALISTNVFPMKDVKTYKNVVQTQEIPAIKRLMAAGDILQFRLQLDETTGTVRAFEVWKDSETQAYHMAEGGFAKIMAQLGACVDVSKLTGKEIHSWSELGPSFKKHMKTVPKVPHENHDCQVFLFKSACDGGNDNIIYYDMAKLKQGAAHRVTSLLEEMHVLVRPLSKSHDLVDVRFHISGDELCSLQVFNNVQAFKKHFLDDTAPYRKKLNELASQVEGTPTGSVWGLPDDMEQAMGKNILVCKPNLVDVVPHWSKPAASLGSEMVFSSQDKKACHRLLEELDRYTHTMLDLLPRRTLDTKRQLIAEPYHVEPPKIFKSKEDVVMIGKYKFRVNKTDDYFGNQGWVDSLVFNTMSNGHLFPIDDKFLDIPDELVACMKSELLFDQIIPPPNHYFAEIESDAAIERMIMSGVLSLWLKDHQNGFKVDLSAMGNLECRPGFRRLGATAYLNSAGKLTEIHVCDNDASYKPGDAGWMDAKTVLKISGAQWNTAIDHLLGVHMIATNPVISAAIQCLPVDHSIRRLIQPFSFRSVYVNERALKSLLDPHSIVLHGSGYDTENFMKLMEEGVRTCELWLPPPERVDNAGKNVRKLVEEKRFPYGEDSIRLYEVFRTFVSEWVDQSYPKDDDVRSDKALQAFAKDLNDQTQYSFAKTPVSFDTKESLVRCLATFCFNATGQHEYAGTVQEYIMHPRFMGFRIRPGSTRVDMQTWLIGMLLFSVTSLPMPHLDDDHHKCYTKDEEQVCWQKCKKALAKASDEVEQANKNRINAFNSFNPSILECSVNV